MDILPEKNEEYKTKEYWDLRYQKSDVPFDWFKGYAQLKPVLGSIIEPHHRILNAGCGNSELSRELYQDGCKSVVGVDFSPICIEQMKQRHTEFPELEWLVMDVMSMDGIADESFDVVIDKGTIDAIMCERGDVWEVDPAIKHDVDRVVSEYYRVLKKGGYCIYITFGQPHFRRQYFLEKKFDWTFETKTIGDAFHYFVYIMKKSDN
eukprot:TRINITY_DN3876_c0_g1_i2.p1 TRINITY_DN3876_c0_g1~~TRINITY_DN3876_c0_g1_i2.p1  ORF type:complete len:207 (+),score=52.21 TRINITY_DN3876_c0_g1_i2:60-680(+)